MVRSGNILWLFLSVLERLLALYAVYHLAEPGIRRLNDQIIWWSITAKWWPRHTLSQKASLAYPDSPTECCSLTLLQASGDGPMLYQALPTHPVCIRLLIIEALSYVWGSNNDPQEIIVNDCSVLVTRNLLHALQGIPKERSSGCCGLMRCVLVNVLLRKKANRYE